MNYQRYCDNIILSMTINHSETENSAISIFVELNGHLLPSASNYALADKLRGVGVYLLDNTFLFTITMGVVSCVI